MFHIAIDETGILAKIRVEAQQKIAKEMESSMNQQIRAYFATNKDHVLNYQNGVGTDIINGVVDDLLLSKKTEQKIKDIIQRRWDRILEDAVLRSLQHQANKIAFNDPQIKSLTDTKE